MWSSAASRLDAFLVNAIAENNRKGPTQMGKLSELAARIKDTRKMLDDEADALHGRLNKIDETAPYAFSQANALVQGHQRDIAELEQELKGLSNLPLETSPDESSDSSGPREYTPQRAKTDRPPG
jgi:hypothetical protein